MSNTPFLQALLPLEAPTGPIEAPEYGPFGVRDAWSNSGVTYAAGGPYGTSRAIFNGSSQLSRATELQFPSDRDYTIEITFRTSLLTQQYQTIFCADNYDGVYVNYDHVIYFLQGSVRCSIDVTLATNTDYHVAVVRSGGVIDIYLNGVKGNVSYNYTGNTNVRYIGGKSIQFLTGELSNFRSHTQALYTENFTPPSAPFDTSAASVNVVKTDYLKRKFSSGVQPLQFLDNTRTERAKTTQHYGQGVISGNVKEARTPTDLPLRRKVRLHDALTGDVVRETWSSTTGAYQFANLESKPYYVISFDYKGIYNAVIKDRITPE